MVIKMSVYKNMIERLAEDVTLTLTVGELKELLGEKKEVNLEL